jgi:type VI secretion system protein ImpK
MTPHFAKAVDPVFIYVLELLDRIDRGQPTTPTEEKARIQSLINNAGAMLSESEEWTNFAKYAVIAWIDSELATMRSWEGRDWWIANSLEVDYWGQGMANVEFFRRAREAAQLSRKDALEVFYVCVVLGFRGFYENAPEGDKMRIIEGLSLPPDLRTWTKQQSSAIRLSQDRPKITDARQPAENAPPRYGKQMLLGTIVLLAIVAGVSVPALWIILQQGT